MSDNIDILVKLFETLKTSSDKNEDATHKLILQQLELVSHIKHLPIEDLRAALKEHAIESKNKINNCEETVETKTDNVIKILKTINGKISRMILVVAVSFTIVTSGYFLIRYAAEKSQEKIYETVKQEQTVIMNKRFNKLTEDMIEEIEKRFIDKHELGINE